MRFNTKLRQFDFTSDEDFNITYGCSSPFILTSASKNSWDLYLVDCEAIITHSLLEGTTEFSLSAEFRPTNGQWPIYKSNPPLPDQIYIKVSLAENLYSDVFTLALS